MVASLAGPPVSIASYSFPAIAYFAASIAKGKRGS
jgi:hypothetical protein